MYKEENNFKWAEDVVFEDLYFYFDFMASSPKAFIMPEMTYIYRHREESLSAIISNNIGKVKDMYKIYKLMYNLVDEKKYDEKYKFAIINCAKDFVSGFSYSPIIDQIHEEYNNFLASINY